MLYNCYVNYPLAILLIHTNGRPSPALAQFTWLRYSLRASATGELRLLGGNMQ